MKCIIVDDEPLAREGVELNVNEMGFLELIGQFQNAITANAFLLENEVDLMFLDIQMPGITGIEWLKDLENPPLVILTTAYPEFALKGFELNVVDYLLKPIRLNRFMKAVNKAKDIYELKKQETESTDAVQPKQEDGKEYTYVSADRKYIKLFYKDIICIEGMKDYVIIHTTGSKIMPAMNLKTILSQLPEHTFARVNKSYIVNINYIKSIDTDFITLDQKEISLGRTYKEKFINNYVKTNLLKR